MTCPHIRTSDEGTQWCELAEERIRELEAKVTMLEASNKALDEQYEYERGKNQRLREAIYKHRAWLTQGSSGDHTLWKALEGE